MMTMARPLTEDGTGYSERSLESLGFQKDVSLISSPNFSLSQHYNISCNFSILFDEMRFRGIERKMAPAV